MRKIILYLLLSITIVLAGCASKKVRQPTPLVEIEETVKLKQVWSRDVGSGTWDRYLRLTPKLYDNIVYTADRHGKVKAIDAESGKVIWSKGYKYSFTSDIGVSSKYIMIGTGEAEIVVINRLNGEEIWSAEMSNEVISRPVYSSDQIIVKTVDSVVSAFESDTGKFIWKYQEKAPHLTMRVGSAPIVKNNKVFVGFPNGFIVALSLSDGEVLWKKLVTSNVTHSLDNMMVDVDVDPKMYQADLYIAGVNSNLMSIDTSSYSVNWKKKISSYSGLDVDRASVVVTDNDGIVYLYRRVSGRLVWRQEGLRYRGLTNPVIYKGLIFVADVDGYVHVMSHSSGKLLGRVKSHRTGIVASPILYNDKVFVKTNNGYVKSFAISHIEKTGNISAPVSG